MKHVNKKSGKQELRWQTKKSGGNFVDKWHAYRNLHAHATIEIARSFFQIRRYCWYKHIIEGSKIFPI